MGRAFEVRKKAMAATSAAKAKVYSRFGREIYVVAKQGSPDPDSNLALKRLIDKAKANQVPRDVIERAIEKAKGGSTESYSSITYEGFGPGASTVIIECLTDNTNRSIADVRACFNKAHSKLGVGGSVSHSYENTALVAFKGLDEEQVLEALVNAECDARDIEVDEDGTVTVYGEPTDLHKIKGAIEAVLPDVTFDLFETRMMPSELVTLEGEDLELFTRLITLLDDVDDVQEVYHNVQL